MDTSDQQAQLAAAQARPDAHPVERPDSRCHDASVRWPIEPHPDLADLDLVAVAQRPQTLDALAVEPRSVGAAAILDVPGAAAECEQRVLGRDERVVDDDRVVHVTADRVDRVERYRRPGLRSSLG